MYQIKAGSRTVYNSTDDFYPEVGPREHLRSPRYNHALLWCGTRLSFRDTVDNLTLWRGEQNIKLNPMTVRNQIEKEGAKMASAISEITEQTLAEAGFCGDVAPQKPDNAPDLKSCAMAPDKVKEAAEKAKITNYNVSDFEDPTKVTNASVDDICVKAQVPKRPMPDGMEKRSAPKPPWLTCKMMRESTSCQGAVLLAL
jgi:hypothetical protein